jgi:hypothetical protein
VKPDAGSCDVHIETTLLFRMAQRDRYFPEATPGPLMSVDDPIADAERSRIP